MKVRLYKGMFRLIEKSGIGRALYHQQDMLERAGIEVTFKNERDAAAVHINTVFPDALLAALLAILRGQKVIYYGHSTMEDFRNSFKFSNILAPLFKIWIKLCYSSGDIIITPTEYSKSLLLGYGIKKPVYALSNGIDTEFFKYSDASRRRFREKYMLGENQKAVISVGHFIERKGLIEYIRLARQMPDVRFFWFGYTNLELVPSEIRRAVDSAPPNLTFPGYVCRDELRDAYCGCDLFCFMSHEETEGIVVLEALSCSIPVVLRDIPVYGGWLTDGVDVLKAESDEEFFRLASDVLSGSAPDLTHCGRAAAEARSIAQVSRQLTEIYEELLQPVSRDLHLKSPA